MYQDYVDPDYVDSDSEETDEIPRGFRPDPLNKVISELTESLKSAVEYMEENPLQQKNATSQEREEYRQLFGSGRKRLEFYEVAEDEPITGKGKALSASLDEDEDDDDDEEEIKDEGEDYRDEPRKYKGIQIDIKSGFDPRKESHHSFINEKLGEYEKYLDDYAVNLKKLREKKESLGGVLTDELLKEHKEPTTNYFNGLKKYRDYI